MNGNGALGIGLAGMFAWWLLRWSKRNTGPEVGAWALFSATANPEATLALCKRLGITKLVVMVNDASTDLAAPVPFHIFNRDQLRAACKVWRAGGLRFGFTTWCTPRADWLDGMADVGALAQECGAESVDLDLEEPWMVLRSRAAQFIRETTARAYARLRSTFRGDAGVTHIVYADRTIIGIALEFCDYDAPQCYSTVSNAGQRKPGDLERITLATWGPYGRPIVLGVAGWSQEGAYGLHYLDALAASVATARALGVKRIRLWRLDAIDNAEADVIRREFIA